MNCEHYYLEVSGGYGGSLGSLLGYPNARVRMSEFDLICTEYLGPVERISDGQRGWFANGAFDGRTLAEQLHEIYRRAHSQVIIRIKDSDHVDIDRLQQTFQNPNAAAWIFSDVEYDVIPLGAGIVG